MISEFPTLTPFSTPSGIITGPDGALWFAELGSFKIGRITTSGSFSEFPLATPSDRPDGIAVGSDGALWFTLGDTIGRITTGGSVSEFPIPTAGGGPEGITAGPDGALWFVEELGGKIGRITTGGTVSEFPIPTVDSGPRQIVTGPDGALWFTEGGNIGAGANKIGRITTSGIITEFVVPTAKCEPFAIAVGPDGGAVVHREGRRQDRAGHDRRQLHRVRDPNRRQRSSRDHGGPRRGAVVHREGGRQDRAGHDCGSFSEFPVPTAGSVPDQITAGPDGAIWFTMNDSKIGRITVPPTTLTLSPKTASNDLGTPHCVTATVKDGAANPTSDIIVRFSVTGSVNTSGSVATDANGEASFCYEGPSFRARTPSRRSPTATTMGARVRANRRTPRRRTGRFPNPPSMSRSPRTGRSRRQWRSGRLRRSRPFR